VPASPKKKMADTEFGPGTEFFEGMIGSENKVPGHKKVGARFPPQMSGTEFGPGTEAFIEDL